MQSGGFRSMSEPRWPHQDFPRDDDEPHTKVCERLCRDLGFFRPTVHLLKNRIVNVVMTQILMELKAANEGFSALFCNAAVGNTHFEGLRKTGKVEFNFLVNLKLPSGLPPCMVFSTAISPPSTCELRVNSSQISNLVSQYQKNRAAVQALEQLRLWADSEGRISSSKVTDWLAHLVVAYLNTHERSLARLFQLKQTYPRLIREGSSAILLICTQDAPFVVVEVDLVPAFELPHDFTPPLYFRSIRDLQLPWYAEPLPRQRFGANYNPLATIVRVGSSELFWRLSFWRHEDWIYKDRAFIRPAVRLLKHVRDDWGWSLLTNEMITAAVLWDLLEDLDRWRAVTVGEAFFQLARSLYWRVSSSDLRDFWDPRRHLLGEVQPLECIQVANAIGRLLMLIEQEPERLPHELHVKVSPGVFGPFPQKDTSSTGNTVDLHVKIASASARGDNDDPAGLGIQLI